MEVFVNNRKLEVRYELTAEEKEVIRRQLERERLEKIRKREWQRMKQIETNSMLRKLLENQIDASMSMEQDEINAEVLPDQHEIEVEIIEDDDELQPPKKKLANNSASSTQNDVIQSAILANQNAIKLRAEQEDLIRRINNGEFVRRSDMTMEQRISLQGILRKHISKKYRGLERFRASYIAFEEKFTNNSFGHTCRVCERLTFKENIHVVVDKYTDIFRKILTHFTPGVPILICTNCKSFLDSKRVPAMAVYNGFRYPTKPEHLPELDLVTERFVSPMIPFVQIRRLTRANRQYDIHGQVINIPDTDPVLEQELPRGFDDDYCFYVHLKDKFIYKSSSLRALINKQTIKMWLEYLVTTPLYKYYKIKVKQEFLDDDDEDVKIVFDDVIEEIPIDECPTVEHSSSTLLWNKENFFKIAPDKYNVPYNLLFNVFEEEFYFPSIYLGQLRKYNKDVTVSTAMIVSSELRRTDRRGVTPCHLLYLAMKIIRQQIDNCLTVATKFVGPDNNLTRQQLESKEFMNSCIKNNIVFLRCIPNSDWYWADKKNDLFAILRQRGKPTAFMTLTANETGWPGLLQILYKLKNNGASITEEAAKNLPFIQKCTLINDDSITCAIYFNKLIDVIMSILQSPKYSPFEKFRVMNYRVLDYFIRMEFNRGSQRAHILLWHDNAPKNFLGEENHDDATKFIDCLLSVSPSQALGQIELQTHKHSSTCYENIAPNARRKCKFGALFMPCKTTLIVSPLDPPTDDASKQFYQTCRSNYLKIKNNLENIDYPNFEDFYKKNSIESDLHYINILRAGIDRVTIFLKREPCEKWIQPFNPFILSVLGSHMDFQFITDDISCAECVAKCVSKINRGVSNLREKILETMKEHPEFDITQITRKLSVDIINSVEMTTQEAAWYLLREPMSKTSFKVAYIPTIPPNQREKIKKYQLQLRKPDDELKIKVKINYFEQYEQRLEKYEHLTLAQYHCFYYKNVQGKILKRIVPIVIKYRNYDINSNIYEYKREMVTLHMPFRNEEEDIISEMKYLRIYDENEELILNRWRELECHFDVQKIIEISEELS